MKIVFVSNYFNHHQKPFCDALVAEQDVEFHFISTIPMREERKKLGYNDQNAPEYVLCSYLTRENQLRAQELIDMADVVIVGSAPQTMIYKRILAGKLVFRYCERPIKNKLSAIQFLKLYIKEHMKNPIGKSIYLLCASAYTAGDYQRLGLFRSGTYRGGYFPETKKYDLTELFAKKQKNVILWCGRFLDWKRPQDAIRLAKILQDQGYEFEMNLIGAGEMEEVLREQIHDQKLEKKVHLLGTMPPEAVRVQMEKAGVYLFTSNQQEGWGAVLNEAMNSGCAVVASHEIGAAPYLIQNGKNGLLYKSGNVDMLYEKVKMLLDCPDQQIQLGKAAYDTITTKWNAQTAAERFLKIAGAILEGEKELRLYPDGPCSYAEVVRGEWTD